MDLKKLLSLENPTLPQLEETATLLQAAVERASEKLRDLDHDERANALNRLRGLDSGDEARRIARTEAERDRADAAEVLANVQAQIAAELEEQAAEREAVAWGVTWQHLARRRAAIQEVEKLIDRIAALHGTASAAYDQAVLSAPRKPEERAWVTPGHFVEDVSRAVVASLNAKIGHPIPTGGQYEPLERALRIDGLANYLNASEDRLMCSPVLNRDGGKLAA